MKNLKAAYSKLGLYELNYAVMEQNFNAPTW